MTDDCAWLHFTPLPVHPSIVNLNTPRTTKQEKAERQEASPWPSEDVLMIFYDAERFWREKVVSWVLFFLFGKKMGKTRQIGSSATRDAYCKTNGSATKKAVETLPNVFDCARLHVADLCLCSHKFRQFN